MTYFLAQVAVLLLAAYMLGAAIGCLTRRLFGFFFASSGDPLKAGAASTKGVQPVIETSPQASSSSGDQSRFERALSHGPSSTQSTASKTTGTGATSETTAHAVKLDTPTFTPVENPATPSPTPEKADTSSSKTTEQTGTTVTPVTIQTRDTADRAKDAPTPTPAPIEKKTEPATATPAPAAVSASSAEEKVPDEGEKFTSVSVAAAAAAAAAAIAASASARQPQTVSDATEPPASKPADVAKPADEPATATVAPAAVRIVTAPATRVKSDDLTRIRQIDNSLQRELNSAGVTSYEQIASWQAGDVAKFDPLIGSSGRITSENWIEQAQILSKGGTTAFARDKDAGHTSGTTTGASNATTKPMVITPVSLQTADEPARAETAQGSQTPTTSADAGVMAATAAAAASAVAFSATSIVSSPTSKREQEQRPPAQVLEFEEIGTDPLHTIFGVDERIAGLLNAQGVTRFEQIANWSTSDVAHFDGLVGSPGRISGERWVEQARAKGSHASSTGDTTTPPPTTTAQAGAIPVVPVAVTPEAGPEPDQPNTPAPDTANEGSSSKANLSGFRSVRSAALRGGRGARAGGTYDDLKRIRGIGVLIEKKLNSMGITSYDEIANWTNQDMDHISGLLEFKGRIERENWVEQARILASGGHTEFSRRMERGQ